MAAMADWILVEHDLRRIRRRRRELLQEFTRKCMEACEKERDTWALFHDVPNLIRAPRNADLFWETDHQRWAVSFQKRLLTLSCQGQANIWLKIKQEYNHALEGLEAL